MIILFGPAGSGKSVQGQLLAARHGWRYLSTGQLLRDTHDKAILGEMEEKGLVNNKAVYRALIAGLGENADAGGIILDGFPRDLEQAEWLVAALPSHQRAIKAIVNIEVPLDEVIRRLGIRKRFDDNENMAKHRYYDFMGALDEILEFMKTEKVQIININGVGDVEDIHHEIDRQVAKHIQGEA